MSTWLQKATGKKEEEEEQTTGTSGWLAAQQKRAKEKAAANAARAAASAPAKSDAPAAPQPSTETPAQTGRLRPGWDVSDVVREASNTADDTITGTVLRSTESARTLAAATKRFGGMTTDELFSYVPTDERDRTLYQTYMDSRTRVAESLDRQSRQAMSDAASAGYDAEAYREFLGMPGASDEEIFGLAQAIRANNAQARSLEPQKWLEYAEGLKESQARKDSLTEKGRELGSRAAAANEQGQMWEYSNIIGDYGELINSPDYAQKSQYNPKESNQQYRAINGDTAARNQLLDSGSNSRGFSPVTGENNLLGYRGADNDYLFELTDTERGIYNALYSNSPEAADNFIEKLKPYLESRARNTFQSYVSAMAHRNPGLTSAATIPAGSLQSAEYLSQIGDIISTGKINQNSANYRASQMSNAVRGEVSKMIEDKWGNVGSAAYNLGMSMGDFLYGTATGGGTKSLSLALMGTRAAANTTLNLKDRGMDDAAAFTLGSIAGAAEIVTESFSLEKLLNPNLIADGIAKNILKNFLAEASEEGASDILNWAAEYIYDAITGGNEAEWKQQVYDAIQNGADPNDAVLAAIQDNLVQLGTDMLSGGISGGLMSAAGTPFYLNNFNASQQGQYANAIRGNEEGLQALIQSGLESPQNTESRQRAEKAEYQVAKGKTPSTLDVARLVEANQQQINNETAEQSGQGRFRLILPRTTPQNAPTPEQAELLRQAGVPLPAETNTAQGAPPVPQETSNTPGLTLPARTAETAEGAGETPRLTLPARTTETEDGAAETPRLTLPASEQIAAFEDEQDAAERAAQVESELVTRLRASKPGLLMDDYANGIDENERRAIDETAKRLGLRVGFSDTVSVGQDNAKIYDDGVVLIEKNNPNPIGFLYGHEMGHWLQQNSPEAYSEFAKAARATDPEWFKSREEATASTYRNAGIEISPERLQEEVLSDYAGWLVQDADVLDRFINQNNDKPNVLRRLYEAIKALAAKLTGRERQQANTAADLLLRAMNATETAVQNGIMSTGETRSSLEGLGAPGQVLDSDYMAAVNSGDMETAQRMVDEAAKAAGYTIKAYHGTTDDFTKFSRGEQGRNHDGYLEFGGGFYFTPSENEAREWVRRGRSGLSGKAEPKVVSVYLSPRNIINADEPIPRGAEALQSMGMSKAEANFVAGRAYRFINYLAEDKGFNNTEIQDELKSLGYDAIDATYRNGTSGQYVVFDPDQIKSADPVTRDDNGNVIPLSERFNPAEYDIRYSLKGLNAGTAPGSLISEEDLDNAVYEDMMADDSWMSPSAKDIMLRLQEEVDRANEPEQSAQRVRNEEYVAALEDGDIEEAQKLVKEAANEAMPKSRARSRSTGKLLTLYHYTNKNFYEFKPSPPSAGSSRSLGDGYYTSTDENGYKSFGKNKMVLFANITAPFDMQLSEGEAQSVYDKYFRPLHEDRFHTYEPHVLEKLQSSFRVFDYLKEASEKNGVSTSEILAELGYDGIHDGDVWVAFYPEQLKSADVATYNDDGQLIPLSERFNPEEKDTRHSLKGINAGIAPESIQKYGKIPKGEKPARDINVPRKVTDKEDERVSWTARTVLEAKATPDAAIPAIAELVEKGAFSYNVQTDKAAIENAEATIKDKGWSASLADWVKDVTKGNVNKANTAMGWALYNNAANAGDLDTALNVLDLMVRHQRNAAQALQASRILKQLTPEAQLYGVQRSVDNLIKELQERYGKRKNIDIKINRDLAQAFLDAKTEEERQKALEALYKDIGRQVPATFRDKWNAWRYLAMLANPRTHIRNISGNLGFAPVVFAKDQVATVLEGIASAVSKGKVERTKGLVLPVRDHDLVKAAWDRYQSVRDEALGGGKYNDSQMANRWIEEGRTIFKFKLLELARRGNSAALDAEDVWFSQPHYTYALAQYCKANGITPAQIRSGEGMDKADAYAIKEAQKATYRDINAFSDFVSSLGRSADRKTGVGKAASAVLEGVLPFRRTPANILVRGLEYSPLGLMKSLTYDLHQVMSKDADGNPRMSVAEMLDDVSEGLTGTGLMVLGAFLAKLGLLRGHGAEKKKEKDFYDLMGFQNYALTLPNGKSYTLDWLAPESLPLFVGVNIYEKLLENKGDLKMADIIDTASQISEPMLEMSMLQSLNDVFERVGWASEEGLDAVPQILSSAVTSYLTQAIPTLLGQVERTGENTRMTTYTDKNKWLTKSAQYTLGKISAKIPGWDYGQIPYIDAWGRTEETGKSWVDRAFKNMVNPAYTDTVNMSDMEKELLRLYNVSPEENGHVLPSRPDKYITLDKERIDLNGEQYVTYATAKGQAAYDLLTELVESDVYQKASDKDKAKMVDSAYDYAAIIAKGQTLESMGKTFDDYDKLKEQLDKGVELLDLVSLKQEIKNADAENNANSSYDTLEILSAFEALNLPEAKAEPMMEQKLSESQWEKYNTLKDAGINYDTRLDIMRKYSELNADEEMDSGTRALEFARYVDGLNLTGKQTQLVKDTYKFWTQVPAEAKRYETTKLAGLSNDKAMHVAEVLGAIKPLPGKEDVTDIQRYRAIESDKTLTNAEKIKVIGSIMGPELKTEKGNPTQWAKFNTALNNGQTLSQAIDLCENGRLDEFAKWTESAAKGQKVTWDVYDTFLKETAKLDGKENGVSVNGLLKKRVVAYIDSLNLTPEQKDALLTDYNSTYKHDVTWHSGSYGSSSGSGRTYARANLSRLELPRTNTRQAGRLTLPTR